LEFGKLHRNDYTKQQPGFTMINQDFPPLNEPKKHQQNAWNHVQTEIRNNDTPNSKNALLLINENLVAMRESNKKVELKLEKINSKLNQTALDTELHQSTVGSSFKFLVDSLALPFFSSKNVPLVNPIEKAMHQLRLSEPVRIIGIYWPNSQKRNLDGILPLTVDGTILTGDFKATVKE
jgi:hypothetical protein